MNSIENKCASNHELNALEHLREQLEKVLPKFEWSISLDMMRLYPVDALISSMAEDISMLKERTRYFEQQAVLIEKIRLLQDENMELRLMKNRYEEDNKFYREVHRQARGLHQEEMRHGKKIAYKENISVGQVKVMKDKGMSVSQIARELHVSRNTVYSRLREAEKLDMGHQHN